MTVKEMKEKFPEETKGLSDEQLELYCRSIQIIADIFISHAEKTLSVVYKQKLDTQQKLCA